MRSGFVIFAFYLYNYIYIRFASEKQNPTLSSRIERSPKSELTLGELALLTGSFEAELLAFFFARIATQEVSALQGAL
jgi:hypothetical protein